MELAQRQNDVRRFSVTGERMGSRLRYRVEDFVFDGSLRDVCILDAKIEDWQRVFDSVESAGWEVSFSWTLLEVPVGRLPSAGEVFARLEREPEESASLAVQVGNVWFTSYFFEVDEIEFTFDPSDVVDLETFAQLEKFIRRLGDSVGKRVVVTMEGSDHAAMPSLLEYVPV
ncbi:hypothetical protein ACFU99_26045 [Streptomyces sp. NPDC057654]|uniref:hypothetical protein n=1 Tax=Streptomyces sp. NPDC057654 TaxID=3346196 RepID=UPI0036830022